MNKNVTLFILGLWLISMIGSTAYGDVFASRFSVTNPDGSAFDGNVTDGTGAKLWYYLNDTATAVTIKVVKVSDKSTVATINATDQGPSMNPNSAVWDGSGAEAGEQYIFSVETTQPTYSSTEYKYFKFIKTYDVNKNIYTRGVDANIYMNTRGFGNLYASNSDADDSRLRTGVLRFNADASYYGTDAGDPMLIPSLGTVNTGGTFDWSGLSPWYATVDASGKIFISGNGDSGRVYIMVNDSTPPKAFIGDLNNPRGIAVVGTGNDRKVYFAAGTQVLRVDLGNADTAMTNPVVVGDFGEYVRDVIFDDEGYMIVALRKDTTGQAPGGYVARYDISGTLPVVLSDWLWSEEYATGLPVGLALVHGADHSVAADDIVYTSVRGENSIDSTTIGIWELTSIDGFVSQRQIFYPDSVAESIGGNISANADLTVDYAGNIIFFENGNEEIFEFSPPHENPTNTETTQAYDTISVSGSTLVSNKPSIANEFALNQNYPNPFNPSTMISYVLPTEGQVTIEVYDLLGHRVDELFHGNANAGYNAIQWNAVNSLGAKVSSGMYIYRITALLKNGRIVTDAKRMMLLK